MGDLADLSTSETIPGGTEPGGDRETFSRCVEDAPVL
jgi:hypothetical protein